MLVGRVVQGLRCRLLLLLMWLLMLLLLLFGLGQLVDLLRPGRRTAAGARGERRGCGGGGDLDRPLPRLLAGGRGRRHRMGLGGGGRESLRPLRRTGVRRYGVGARGAPPYGVRLCGAGLRAHRADRHRALRRRARPRLLRRPAAVPHPRQRAARRVLREGVRGSAEAEAGSGAGPPHAIRRSRSPPKPA